MPFYKFFFLFILITIFAISVASCGKKAALYIPTEKQKKQLEKEQLEKKAVLKKRNEKK
jgi:predicted small lipoprotein YifL